MATSRKSKVKETESNKAIKGKEILFLVEVLSNEKRLPRDIIFEAIATALARITAKEYGEEAWIKVNIDEKSGDYESFRCWEILPDDELLEISDKQMHVSDAQKVKSNIKVGDCLEQSVPSVEFSRIAAQMAKQIILLEVRKAEKNRIIDEYKQKIGQLLTSTVKKVMRDHVILESNDLPAQVILMREGMLPKESFRVGDRVRAYVQDVRSDAKGPAVILNRACKEMLIELFKLEVPEISESVIEIKGVARDPGSRAKIAVKTNDGRIDPIGACVGMRGSRVQAVSNELNGERVDIILWDANPAQLVINSLAPAQVSSIVVDEDNNTIDVAVKEDQLSLAIGKNGQNVRLAADLTGWQLNILSEEDAVKKNQQEASHLIGLFVKELDVEEDVATVLVQEGFSSLEEVAYVPLPEMMAIEGFDESIATELQNRAQDALLTKAIAKQEHLKSVKPEEDLLNLPGMTEELAFKLAENEILTREDLAEQSVADLLDITGMSEQSAADLIMAARAHWFED